MDPSLLPSPLERAAAEVEAHVAVSGWDRPSALFALVRGAELAVDEPDAATRLGLTGDPDELTPVEQEALPDGPLDEVLAQIAWPAAVYGCVLTQEIVVVPSDADDELDDLSASEAAQRAAEHPGRREGRLAVAVLRDGSTAGVLRLRAEPAADDTAPKAADDTAPEAADDVVTAPELAPNLAAALLATFED